MTWTDPKTWASGDVLTAADMNTHVRDNMRWVGHFSTGGAPIGARYHNAAQNNFSTGSNVQFNTDLFTPVGFRTVGTSTNAGFLECSGVSEVDGFFVVGATVRGVNTGAGRADLGINNVDGGSNPTVARSGDSVGGTAAVLLTVVAGHYTTIPDFTVPLTHDFSDLDLSSNAASTPCRFWGAMIGKPV